MRILLITPPMVQPNTPYPATPHLVGCLRRHAPPGVEVGQADLSMELFHGLFSGEGLRAVVERLRAGRPAGKPGRAGRLGRASRERPAAVAHLIDHADECVSLIDPVVRFLEGRDPTMAARIARRDLLPEGPRFAALDGEDDPAGWAFGALGTTDMARHLASLFVDDLADAVADGIDPRFGLARHGEKLACGAATFEPLGEALRARPTLVDEMLDDLARGLLAARKPDLVGITIPFPGNVYGALRVGRLVKAERPRTRVVLGGGWVSTELRRLSDPRVFDCCDYITLDDGYGPILALVEHLEDRSRPLLRTFVRRRSGVAFETTDEIADLGHCDIGTPTYEGLDLGRYVSLFEMLNPMHRLWSDGRWNCMSATRSRKR